MHFQEGDWVIHSSHGLGKVCGLEEKRLDGQSRHYYVVKLKSNMTLWVPVEQGDDCSLRKPYPQRKFKKIINLLSQDCEQLPEDRYQRQQALAERMRQGTSEAICRLVRDLSALHHQRKPNENDQHVLNRAREFLLSEWEYSLQVPVQEAERQLNRLLKTH